MSNYNQLSALYAQRKEEYAKAQGAYEAYVIQKSKAEQDLKQTLATLQSVILSCPDEDISSDLNSIIMSINSSELTPEFATKMMSELNSVINSLESKIKECLQ